MDVASRLPAPVGSYKVYDEKKSITSSSLKSSRKPTNNIPSYPNRTTSSAFIPRVSSDYADGGAYPEIHVAQYPLRGMGSTSSSHSSKTLAKTNTNVASAIANKSSSSSSIVYSSFTDIVEKKVQRSSKPSDEAVQKTASKTRAALDAVVQSKVAASNPSVIAKNNSTSSYVKYTANPEAPGYNPAAATRIVRMVEAPVDPMEPPKFKHRKAPRGPSSPPVPVLHSPPRKVTVKDQQAWKIPPCVSNWKNAKGYTIPLDKRLAADGRGLTAVTINDQFASLSEALAIAERKAREEVGARATVQAQLLKKQKAMQEEELRALAASARRDFTTQEYDTNEEAHERNEIRASRKREREREMRLDNRKGKGFRSDRDVSEKMALGLLTTKDKIKGDSSALFDTRLFNQSAGMTSGFGDEEDYNVYSKPLGGKSASSSIYRPKNNASESTDADAQIKELKSSNKFMKASDASKRDGPVQFEKEPEDVFGLDAFLTEAKKSSSSSNTGMMAISSAGTSYDTSKRSTNRRKEFTK